MEGKACRMVASRLPFGNTLTPGETTSLHDSGRAAPAASHALDLGTVQTVSTTPADVVPGRCARLTLALRHGGWLAVDAVPVRGSGLSQLVLGTQLLDSCPGKNDEEGNLAAEFAPARSGYISLAACVPAGFVHVYALGAPAFSTFNVSARLLGSCAAPAAESEPEELGPLPAADAVGLLVVAACLMLCLAAFMWTLARGRRRASSIKL